MTIELSQMFLHNTCNANGKKYSDEELKNVILKLMEENGINANPNKLADEGVLQVNETSNLKLHRLMLQAEELGLEMKYTKKTLIEFC